MTASGSLKSLMRLVPIPRRSRIHHQRHRQGHGRFRGLLHGAFDHGDGVLGLGFRGLEDQLVVDLEQHPG